MVSLSGRSIDFGPMPSTQQRNSSSTAQQFVQLPANLLEAFIPGYETISRLLFEAFGFDITLIVSISFLLFALFKSIDFLQHQLLSILTRFGTCSVSMDSTGDSYYWMVDWLAARGIGRKSSSLLAVSNPRAAPWQAGPDNAIEFFIDGQPLTTAPAVNARVNSPKIWYEPSLGSSQYFWHKGRLFLWYRYKEQRASQNPLDFSGPATKIEARLYCLSRSTAPIKALIRKALDDYQKRSATKTSIRRPAPSKQRREGMNLWMKVATRPSRPMDTIILNEAQKQRVLADMEEYLEPGTCNWYAERGIPYRRGYLFYGPPGTGKTSLSFALAGVFGLDVYCISLAEPSITEEDLAALFDQLPEHCLVLLEDIDSAGLASRTTSTPEPPLPPTSTRDFPNAQPYWQDANLSSSDAEDDDAKTAAFADNHERSLFPPSSSTHLSSRSRISLSGLLNVLDGVASHEGRVLIMTTNHVERLDGALLRPGRIDVRIRFELATRAQAEHVFVQIYSHSSQQRRSRSGSDGVSNDGLLKKPHHGAHGSTIIEKPTAESSLFDAHKIADMARAFAAEIPDRALSTAEIQGFLMTRKKQPMDAVAEVGKWVAAVTSLKVGKMGR